MKKFLSYLLTFITLLVISATITIKVKSDILESNVSNVNASASSEASLLSGLMTALEDNPKLDVSAQLYVVIDGKPMDLCLNAKIDVTKLTNPNVSGNLTINYGGDTLDILFTYFNDVIYLSYNNIQVKFSVDSIKDLIKIFSDTAKKELILKNSQSQDSHKEVDSEENLETTQPDSGLSLDLDALMDALNNPTKTVIGDDYIYEVNLPDICKLVIVCDKGFNIKSADISNFTMLNNVEVTGKVNVVIDKDIVIADPSNADEHLDVGAITHAFDTLKNNRYLRLNAWAALYKEGQMVQNLQAFGKVDLKNNRVSVSSSLNGLLDAKLNLDYFEDNLYINFNDLYLASNKDGINQLDILLKSTNIKYTDLVAGIFNGSAEIVSWLENNYQEILDTAIINSNQIKLVANLNGILGQTSEVSFIVTFNNGLISGIQISGISINGYTLKLTVYVDSPKELMFNLDTQKYYQVNDLLQTLVPIVSDKKFKVTADFNILSNNNNFNFSANANIDLSNNIFVGDITLLDKILGLGYDGNNIYINYDQIYAKIDAAELFNIISTLSGNSSTELLFNVSQFVNGLSLNDMLSLFNLSSNKDGISLYADLSTLFNKSIIISVNVSYSNGVALEINVTYDDYTILGTINISQLSEDVSIPNNQYQDVTNLVKEISSLTQGNNFVGSLDVKYKDISLNGNYQLSLNNDKSTVNVKFMGQLCDLNINIALVDNVIYCAIDDLKVYMPISEINDLVNWINVNFNKNININDLSNLFKNSSLDNINITLLELLNDKIAININQYNLAINLKNGLNIQVSSNDLLANATLGITEEPFNFNTQGYVHFSEVLNLANSVINLVKQKQFALNGTAEVYEGNTLHYSAIATVQVDLQDFAVFGEIIVTDHIKNIDMPFMIAFNQGMWYVDYNNLKVKIAKNDLNEILVVLLELAGVDPSLIPFLQDAVNGMDINVGNISAIVPNIDFSNPISMIKFVKGLSFNGTDLSLKLDSKLTSVEGEGDMLVCIKTNGSKLTNVTINNLYTGVTLGEHFNLDVNVIDYKGVNKPYEGKYIDLSGSNELIKAIINTAELNYFNITGNLDITVMGINLGKVYIDAQVKLDEERKPEIIISLPNIPVIGAAVGGLNVNNDVPYKFGDGAVDSRQAVIYYKDGYVYMYRKDVLQVSRRTYEKKLKVHIDQMLADPMYYVQYLTGFTDQIIDAIKKSLALSEGHTPDLGNIINEFKVNNKTDFSIKLNMHELTNDPNMGEMSIGLNVINTPETGNKNYVGKATFSLTLPFTDAITMVLNSDDLALVNIGKTLDFSSLYNYISSYNYSENEEWEASNGSWKKADERTNTISFNSMGGANVDNITAKVGEPITVPALPNKVVIDSATGTRYTYKFDGWYTDNRFKDGTKFTETIMPRKDTQLYAKWVLIKTEKIVTISFNSNGGSAISSISELQGTYINVNNYVPTKDTIYQDKGYNWTGKNAGKWTYLVTTYNFEGWYTDSSCTSKFNGIVPDNNITLYAKWNSVTETKYFYNWERP